MVARRANREDARFGGRVDEAVLLLAEPQVGYGEVVLHPVYHVCGDQHVLCFDPAQQRLEQRDGFLGLARVEQFARQRLLHRDLAGGIGRQADSAEAGDAFRIGDGVRLRVDLRR